MTSNKFARECKKLFENIQDDISFAMIRASDLMGEKRSFLRKMSIFLTPPLICIFLYRLSHLSWVLGFKVMARFIGWVNFVLHKASLSPASEIGGGLYLPHTVGVLFHGRAGKRLILFANAAVSSNLNIEASNHINEYPVLGDDVVIGAWGSIIGEVTVGSHSKITPYTTVTRNIPPNSLVFSRVPRGKSGVHEGNDGGLSV
jgi:serine O-acetyltransferase